MIDADELTTLLTVKDLSRILRVSRWAIYTYVKSGELRAVRIGHHLRFRPADIAAYVDARTTIATEAG